MFVTVGFVVYTLQYGDEANVANSTPVSLITFNMLLFFAVLFMMLIIVLPIAVRKLKEEQKR
jgi:hypothetical protein